MTTPALAFSVPKKGRHYPYDPTLLPEGWDNTKRNAWKQAQEAGCEAWPSVSNIKGILDGGPGLKGWFAEQALYEIVEERSVPPFGRDQSEIDAWVRYHKWAMNRRGKKRAQLGTDAHTLAEALTTDEPIPAELGTADATYGDALLSFLVEHDVETLYVERTVFDPAHKYAGTFDAIAVLDGKTTLLDYKTRDVKDDGEHKPAWWPEDKLQLAALAYADEMWDADEAMLVPTVPVEQVAIVALYPDGECEVHRWTKDEVKPDFECFTRLREAWDWKVAA